ncbi:ROK family transcriptional regulator [Microlunatus soli]|uniref:Sugar kinase of the NBD/HSP70 family, may contain an N-terminal HTH domain n=1 Tax=Microlunatus soli TaxID=630515 RepID=A0A1H1YGX4_9ACTN|nr:ROK family transcriptional regulator [Microlunatus soli]SDT20768.1 Sugar kinase of the NBD/HSP70 family, may contain an N-terminal HTH domain [Microlunatus soli]
MSHDLHRQANTAAVLRALSGQGAASVSELRALTGLSRPTLDAIVGSLLADGLVLAEEPDRVGRTGAGRPARSYLINADAGFLAGVDVGRHKILVSIADLTGAVRVERRAEVPAEIAGPDLLSLLRRTVTEAAAAVPIPVGQLRAIAVGVPGVVDSTGRITRSVVVPQWSGFDVAGAIRDWVDVPIAIGNDANLAALAEQWLGAARMCRDVIYILAGRRTRAAIMINRSVLTGRHGEAGEVGSVPELFFDTPQVLLGEQTADSTRVAEVFAAARAGDQDGVERVRRFCAELARTLRFLITVLDPELVVIGGGLSAAGEQIIAGVHDHLEPAQRRTPVVASTLGDTAVALGGVRQAQLMAAENDPLFGSIISVPTTASAVPEDQYDTTNRQVEERP